MEGKTLLNFSNNPFAAPPTPFYATYHTPPYTLNTVNTSSWTDCTYHQPLSMSEDVLQMQQQLRFPTPPITPPRIYHTAVGGDHHHQLSQAADEEEEEEHQQQTVAESSNIIKSTTTTTSAVPLRTQSVIMKIGHDQSPPHHLPADDLPYRRNAYQTEEDNSDKLESHHHEHHLQHQHHDTPSSGTSSPTSSNDFVCDWIECGRYFESLELLAIHVTQIHAVASLADGLYYCRWSGCQRTERGFNARYKMLVHVRTHTKEKPHQCHLCDKRFSRAENLKIHIRSHSGEKPYICTFEGCNKAYSNSSDRFKHTRTHSMEKPYMCKVPGCHKRYTDPSSLRKHVKTFKHSMQIMDSKTTTPPPYHQAQQYPHQLHHHHHHHQLQNSLDESRFSPLEQSEHTYPSSYHLIMATAPKVSAAQDSFCMAMEEMCHIRATLDCYKTTPTTPADSENYWLHDDTDSRPSLYHSNYTPAITRDSELTMDLTTEKPLDLRVKRC